MSFKEVLDLYTTTEAAVLAVKNPSPEIVETWAQLQIDIENVVPDTRPQFIKRLNDLIRLTKKDSQGILITLKEVRDLYNTTEAAVLAQKYPSAEIAETWRQIQIDLENVVPATRPQFMKRLNELIQLTKKAAPVPAAAVPVQRFASPPVSTVERAPEITPKSYITHFLTNVAMETTSVDGRSFSESDSRKRLVWVQTAFPVLCRAKNSHPALCLRDVLDAQAYLDNFTLRTQYIQKMEQIVKLVREKTLSKEELLILLSSLTLFSHVFAETMPGSGISRDAQRSLRLVRDALGGVSEQFPEGPKCAVTEEHLRKVREKAAVRQVNSVHVRPSGGGGSGHAVAGVDASPHPDGMELEYSAGSTRVVSRPFVEKHAECGWCGERGLDVIKCLFCGQPYCCMDCQLAHRSEHVATCRRL